MPFVSKTLQHSFCACVRNILKIVMFVIEKMKLVSFSLRNRFALAMIYCLLFYHKQ